MSSFFYVLCDSESAIVDVKKQVPGTHGPELMCKVFIPESEFKDLLAKEQIPPLSLVARDVLAAPLVKRVLFLYLLKSLRVVCRGGQKLFDRHHGICPASSV